MFKLEGWLRSWAMLLVEGTGLETGENVEGSVEERERVVEWKVECVLLDIGRTVRVRRGGAELGE